MTNLQVFDNSQFGQVRSMLRDGEPWFVAADVCEDVPERGSTPYHGYVYAIEYGHGVKIGCTTKLKSRIKSIKRDAKNYSDLHAGAFAYSQPHTNYRENEKLLHKFFEADRVKRSERFSFSLCSFLDNLPLIKFRDESNEKATQSEAFMGFMKSFVGGGASGTNRGI